MGKMQKWYCYPLEGCVSGNGKPYRVSFKKGIENKLLVNFLGGGASWNIETASKPITMQTLVLKKEAFYLNYVPVIAMKLGHVGLLSATDKRNPFRNWYILNIPYSTADFHLGTHDFHYNDDKGKDKILYHHGAKNMAVILTELKRLFSGTPDMLMISGLSAGAFGCLAHAPAIKRLYPDCGKTVVYAESAHLRSSLWQEIVKDIWQADPDLAAYTESEDLIVDLFHYAEDNMPTNTQFLHFVSVWDEALTQFMSKMNHGKVEITEQSLQVFHNSLIDVVKRLKAERKNYFYYLTDYGKKKDGSTPHVFFGYPKMLYSKMQDGVSLADWIFQAFEKNPLDVGGNFIK